MAVHMKVLKNREEWLKNREHTVGGSEAAALVGKNPYMTNIDLYRIKTGQQAKADIDDKEYVIYGRNAEEHLRALFALDYPQYEVDYIDNNSFWNDKYPWASASLDGWLTDQDGRKGILEIKTTNILQSMQKEKWDHRIPDNYYCQVLFYLGVTEFDFVDLRANLKYHLPDKDLFIITKDFHIERTDPNVEEDIATIMEATAKFAERLKKNEEPPLLLSI